MLFVFLDRNQRRDRLLLELCDLGRRTKLVCIHGRQQRHHRSPPVFRVRSLEHRELFWDYGINGTGTGRVQPPLTRVIWAPGPM